ncbi:MAG: 5'-nucleotidase C-terminal domain-containing protein [Proteobacteria bacterium]|nr:5'-nucleotidase C-terminal domain-containing protein [Pseudomonadota bacterium]
MTLSRILVAVILVFIASTASAAEKRLTLVHANDLHSHLLGFSPNIDYTPQRTGDDRTVGGWARLASAIERVRRERPGPVLVLDAGDFMMGSLFHLISREEAVELRLLYRMGYDLLTLGNHEFDLKPRGLARILAAARDRGELPRIVSSNAVFSAESDQDDELERLFKEGLVEPYRVLERDGLRIGFFGLMGRDAAQVAPFARPMTFEDPVAAAGRMVRLLREREKVDLVVCLSHGGLAPVRSRSEDIRLAEEVEGIDVIIGGHTHTRVPEPLRVGRTLIVQAGSYGRFLGVMDLVLDAGQVRLDRYELVNIDDRIPGDGAITEAVRAFEDRVDRTVLEPMGLGFQTAIAATAFDLRIEEDESNLGNLISDAIRWSINRYDSDPADPASRVVLGVISNGVIRDDILVGRTGRIAVCDAFRAIPLGVGSDDTPGYPLVSFYIDASELKKVFEILASIHPLKGPDYFIQFSGARVRYNPHRMLFDRVIEISLGDEETGYVPLDYSRSNRRLYRVGADIYNSTFLKVIGGFTYGILEIAPKDRQGRPIADLKTARVDADKRRDGIQELKEWRAVIDFLRGFSDRNGDGLPDVPERYRTRLGRQTMEASWNPYKLVKGGTWVTWLALALAAAVLALIGFGVHRFRRRVRGRS